MIDSEEKFPLGVLDFYVDNKDLDNIHMLKKFWNEKYLPEYEESKNLQQRIDKAMEILSKINYEDINEYIPPLEILPAYEILRGNSNEEN